MLRHLTLSVLILSSFLTFAQKDLTTWYEISGKKETPRYSETMEFCKALRDASPMVHFVSFGISPQGRELPLLILDRQGLSDPLSIRKNGKAIVLVQACIHPGESEGKDAGFLFIRDIITGKLPVQLLDRVSVLFIPIFNVDGHERFGPYNRINQNGPKEMGWRTTAVNLNLNRDYLKAEAPEMQAWLKLFNEWNPDFFIDIHTTDGADYQYSITYHMELLDGVDAGIAGYSKDFLSQWTKNLNERGVLNFTYVTFRNWFNPKSGLITGQTSPMFSQGYTSMRNRPGLLIETHMLKPYDIRVEASYAAIVEALKILNQDHDKLISTIRTADQFTASSEFRKPPFALRYDVAQNDSVMVDFLGYSYEEIKSPVTGDTWFLYGDRKTTYRLPYFGKIRPKVTTRLPEAYIIPAEWSNIIEKLKMHAIKLSYIEKDTTIRISTYRFKDPKWQPTPYEGHHLLYDFSAEEITIEKYFAKGSAIVRMDQPDARIIAHMLEPWGDGSFLGWGYFDAVFEQKEYAERYVLEPMALEYLKDPAIKAEFDHMVESDTTFMKNSWQVLNWFYSKSPYWDKNIRVYPIGKIF